MSSIDPFIENESPQVQRPHHLLTVLAWVVIIALIIAVYLYKTGYFVYSSPSTTNTTASLVPAAGSGYLFLNMAQTGGSLKLYLYDVAHKSLSLSNIQSFSPSASVDGRYFVGVVNDPKTSHASIYEYDTVAAASMSFTSDVAGAAHAPRLSPDNTHVVFMVPPIVSTSSVSELLTPHNWRIEIAAKGEGGTVIANGMYPQWSPDGGSVLYMSDDGLHLYTLSSKSDAVVYAMPTDTTTGIQMSLNVTNDGRHFVWTSPRSGKVMIAQIHSWSPFTESTEKILPITALSPQYAPDGSSIVMQEFDSLAASSSSRLVLYDTATGGISTLMNLTSYDPARIFITGWAKHL